VTYTILGWNKVLEPLLKWKYLPNLASLIAVILAVIVIFLSKDQFKKNSKSSTEFLTEIQRLQDSTIVQSKRNKLASDTLIVELKKLQEITKSQLFINQQQQRTAELAARELEEYQKPNIKINRIDYIREKRFKDYYIYGHFNGEFYNNGRSEASEPEFTIYVLTSDTLCRYIEYSISEIMPGSNYYLDGVHELVLKSEIDIIYLYLIVKYKDLRYKRSYEIKSEYLKCKKIKNKVFEETEINNVEIEELKKRIKIYNKNNPIPIPVKKNFDHYSGGQG
jgi:hypothetical protein